MTDPIDGWIKEHLGETRPVPADLTQRAKDLMPGGRAAAACPHCGKPITPFKKSPRAQAASSALWLVAAAVSFALSFMFERYFLQFLLVTLLCGIQGIVQRRALKTQILIYKALSEEGGSEGSRLHRHASRL